MKDWRHYATTAAGTALVMGALSFTHAGVAIADQVKSTMTLITNGPDQPVPVNLVAPSAVPVAVNGTVAVRPPDDGSKQVFAQEVSIGWGGTGTFDCSSPITVPAGKRVVLEYWSAETVLLGSDQLWELNIRSAVPFDNRILATMHPVLGGTGGGHGPLWSGSETVKLYLDRDFMVCGWKADTTIPSFFSSTLWGYTVDRS